MHNFTTKIWQFRTWLLCCYGHRLNVNIRKIDCTFDMTSLKIVFGTIAARYKYFTNRFLICTMRAADTQILDVCDQGKT